MTKEEMLEYLKSTGLYGDNNEFKSNIYYIEEMMGSDKTISFSELVEMFIDVDKYCRENPDIYDSPNWNIRQILANLSLLIPIEDKDLYEEK